MTLDELQETIIDALPAVAAEDLEAVAKFVQAKIDDALMEAADAAAIRLNNIYTDDFTRVVNEDGIAVYYVEHFAAAQAVRAVIENKSSIAAEAPVNA